MFQIFDVWKTNFEIRIQRFDQTQLWIVFDSIMNSWNFFVSSSSEIIVIITLSISKISRAKSSATWRFCLFSVEFWNCMLIVKRKIWMWNQNEIIYIHERTISFRFIFKYTNKIYLKSSQKQTILLSKKICSWISIKKHKFDMIRLTINMSYFRCMNDSFQKINLICCINLIRSNSLNISQKLLSSKFKFFWKRACAVVSSINKIIAMSNEITTSTMISSKRSLFMTIFCTKILLVSF